MTTRVTTERESPLLRWAVSSGLGLLVGAAARHRGALSNSGALAAAGIGAAVVGAGGLPTATLLLTFFGSSTALSILPIGRRDSGVQKSTSSGLDPAASLDRGDGPRRTLVQVLANGGVPAVLALRGGLAPSPRLRAAYAGALAAANADTWATEIGGQSSSPPRSIVTLRPVVRGVSGGVTPLGLGASVGGALTIAATSAALRGGGPGAVGAVGSAGVLGALMDSILGATLQAVYRCDACGERTEERTHHHGDDAPVLTLTRGLSFMTNDTVNLCASATGALVATLLTR